jgi:hypothetical protein
MDYTLSNDRQAIQAAIQAAESYKIKVVNIARAVVCLSAQQRVRIFER